MDARPHAAPRAHWLDVAYAWQARRRPLFQHGWGDESLLQQAMAEGFPAGAPGPVDVA